MMDWRVFAFMAVLLLYDGASRYRAETGAAAQDAAKAAGAGVDGRSLLDDDELVPAMEQRSGVAHPGHEANRLHIEFCQG